MEQRHDDVPPQDAPYAYQSAKYQPTPLPPTPQESYKTWRTPRGETHTRWERGGVSVEFLGQSGGVQNPDVSVPTKISSPPSPRPVLAFCFTFSLVTARAACPTLPTTPPRRLWHSSPTPPLSPRVRRRSGRFREGDRARRRGAGSSGPGRHESVVDWRKPPPHFAALGPPTSPRAPCADLDRHTKALGPGPHSAGERTACRGWRHPPERGCSRRLSQASVSDDQMIEEDKERGKLDHARTPWGCAASPISMILSESSTQSSGGGITIQGCRDTGPALSSKKRNLGRVGQLKILLGRPGSTA